jgi:hypothetical protein
MDFNEVFEEKLVAMRISRSQEKTDNAGESFRSQRLHAMRLQRDCRQE